MSDWPSFRCPGFSVPDRSHFFPIHLASEAAAAAAKLVVYIVGMAHLTLSFDGWSSKGHDEIYTLSITTLLDGHSLLMGWCLLASHALAKLYLVIYLLWAF
jgi:hypothetical protein